LFVWQNEARAEFAVDDGPKRRRKTPSQTTGYGRILDFGFISRMIASKLSMEG
jgi:hypothetical protein